MNKENADKRPFTVCFVATKHGEKYYLTSLPRRAGVLGPGRVEFNELNTLVSLTNLKNKPSRTKAFVLKKKDIQSFGRETSAKKYTPKQLDRIYQKRKYNGKDIYTVDAVLGGKR